MYIYIYIYTLYIYIYIYRDRERYIIFRGPAKPGPCDPHGSLADSVGAAGRPRAVGR